MRLVNSRRVPNRLPFGQRLHCGIQDPRNTKKPKICFQFGKGFLILCVNYMARRLYHVKGGSKLFFSFIFKLFIQMYLFVSFRDPTSKSHLLGRACSCNDAFTKCPATVAATAVAMASLRFRCPKSRSIFKYCTYVLNLYVCTPQTLSMNNGHHKIQQNYTNASSSEKPIQATSIPLQQVLSVALCIDEKMSS